MVIEADVEHGGSVLDGVALQYFRAIEEYGLDHEDALKLTRSYSFDNDRNLSEEDIMRRVENAKLYVKSREKRQAIYFYDPFGDDAGELYYPHPDQLIWKPA